jgi:hypothetical protein
MIPTRIDAGPDVAMVGAWDEARNANTLLDLPYKQYIATLASDAELGHLFMIQLGGEWGGPIDVFVNNDILSTLRRRLRRVKGVLKSAAARGEALLTSKRRVRRCEGYGARTG